jgi:hypothetical protein
VRPHAREAVLFVAVPLPKKAPAETLGGTTELLEAGVDWSTSEMVAEAAEGTRLGAA